MSGSLSEEADKNFLTAAQAMAGSNDDSRTPTALPLNLVILPSEKRETLTKDSQPDAVLWAWEELLHPQLAIGEMGQLRRGEIPKMTGYQFEALTLFTGGASLRVLAPPRGLRRRRKGLLTILVAANAVFAPALWRTLRAPDYDSILPYSLEIDSEEPPPVPWCAALTEIGFFEMIDTHPNGSGIAAALISHFARVIPLILAERTNKALPAYLLGESR